MDTLLRFAAADKSSSSVDGGEWGRFEDEEGGDLGVSPFGDWGGLITVDSTITVDL